MSNALIFATPISLTVSYTHLDVYKRQVDSILDVRATTRLPEPGTACLSKKTQLLRATHATRVAPVDRIALGIEAVSYTHLDVYKRQS